MARKYLQGRIISENGIIRVPPEFSKCFRELNWHYLKVVKKGNKFYVYPVHKESIQEKDRGLFLLTRIVLPPTLLETALPPKSIVSVVLNTDGETPVIIIKR